MSNANDAAVEEALARVALTIDADIVTLRPLFDSLSLAPSSPALLADLHARFVATFGIEAARALTHDAADVAEVARRGERLIRIVSAVGRD